MTNFKKTAENLVKEVHDEEIEIFKHEYGLKLSIHIFVWSIFVIFGVVEIIIALALINLIWAKGKITIYYLTNINNIYNSYKSTNKSVWAKLAVSLMLIIFILVVIGRFVAVSELVNTVSNLK